MKLHIVPAHHSVQWLQLGFQTFWRQPLALGLISFLLITFQPFVTLLIMVVAAETHAGPSSTRALALTAWRALRQDFWALLKLWALYVGACLLILGVTVSIGSLASGGFRQPTGEASLDFLWAVLIFAAIPLFTLLTLLFWHAPGLIHWHRLSPIQALFLSSTAMRLNWRAFSLFFLMWGLIYAVSGLALTLMMALPVTAPWDATLSELARQFMICVVAVLNAIGLTCIYFTFRDCFSAPGNADLGAD